jgi:predicted metal-dependent HD superfamily phosphohydrolase
MISGAVRDELIARYGEPHRRYHTMVHVQDCLDKLAACDDLNGDERRLLEAALWFHDAVYDPTRNDNEAESARLAEDRLTALGEPAAFIAEVSRLILLTAGHTVEAGDRLGARLVSIDLSILGTDPAAYDAYAADIRAEYAHVPEPLYRAGRAAIMSRFVESEVLFPDPAWAARLDTPARANLRREIATMTA